MFHVKHSKNIDYYKELYYLALKSFKIGDVPVGCIIIYNNKIIGRGYNNRQKKGNILGHAEINAILNAEKKIKDWRLNNCILITTLKPCKICAEVIKESRISKVYYLINQEKVNYDYNFNKINDNNKYINKYNELFTAFFKKLR